MYIRLGFFFGILIMVAIAEVIVPRRPLSLPKSKRWVNNLGLVMLNSLASRIIIPTGAIGAATFAQTHNWGLFNQMSLSLWVSIGFSLIILDLIIYLHHILLHAIPVFWRIHMVHHVDQDFDVTTGLRFHTIEIILSMSLKMAVISLLGAPVLAVIIFEIVLNGTAMFNHGNFKLPKKWDRMLRFFLVTPDMHRIHHSTIPSETNSNYGFNLPWWDYLFKTHCFQPSEGHLNMKIGLSQFQDKKVDKIMWKLALPFTQKAKKNA